MITLLDLGITFLQQYLGTIKNKVPAEIAAGVQAALDSLMKHRDDLVTKANLEAQRG